MGEEEGHRPAHVVPASDAADAVTDSRPWEPSRRDPQVRRCYTNASAWPGVVCS
jgi:hypothetical protein